MRVDKKSRGAQLRFVVLDGLAAPDGPGGARRGDCCASAYDVMAGVPR